jgi:intermembrane space import and assembly protein 40
VTNKDSLRDKWILYDLCFRDKLANLQLTRTTVSLRPQPKVEEETDNLPTLDSIKTKRRQEQQKQQQVVVEGAEKTEAEIVLAEGVPQPADGLASTEELEEQAGQEGAFNPETGEINWDCPCLGGMAHGPCGEEFKAAFSCFVYSTEEPKGIDFIEKFKYVHSSLLFAVLSIPKEYPLTISLK